MHVIIVETGKYVDKLKTWERAKDACKAAGLTLPSARSLEETEELRNALTFFLGESGFENCLGAFGQGKTFFRGSDQSNCGKIKRRWDPVHWAWTGGQVAAT